MDTAAGLIKWYDLLDTELKEKILAWKAQQKQNKASQMDTSM
jgi:hypothetical protein